MSDNDTKDIDGHLDQAELLHALEELRMDNQDGGAPPPGQQDPLHPPQQIAPQPPLTPPQQVVQQPPPHPPLQIVQPPPPQPFVQQQPLHPPQPFVQQQPLHPPQPFVQQQPPGPPQQFVQQQQPPHIHPPVQIVVQPGGNPAGMQVIPLIPVSQDGQRLPEQGQHQLQHVSDDNLNSGGNSGGNLLEPSAQEILLRDFGVDVGQMERRITPPNDQGLPQMLSPLAATPEQGRLSRMDIQPGSSADENKYGTAKVVFSTPFQDVPVDDLDTATKKPAENPDTATKKTAENPGTKKTGGRGPGRPRGGGQKQTPVKTRNDKKKEKNSSDLSQCNTAANSSLSQCNSTANSSLSQYNPTATSSNDASQPSPTPALLVDGLMNLITQLMGSGSARGGYNHNQGSLGRGGGIGPSGGTGSPSTPSAAAGSPSPSLGNAPSTTATPSTIPGSAPSTAGTPFPNAWQRNGARGFYMEQSGLQNGGVEYGALDQNGAGGSGDTKKTGKYGSLGHNGGGGRGLKRKAGPEQNGGKGGGKKGRRTQPQDGETSPPFTHRGPDPVHIQIMCEQFLIGDERGLKEHYQIRFPTDRLARTGLKNGTYFIVKEVHQEHLQVSLEEIQGTPTSPKRYHGALVTAKIYDDTFPYQLPKITHFTDPRR